jgi:anti-anti-sigma factor
MPEIDNGIDAAPARFRLEATGEGRLSLHGDLDASAIDALAAEVKTALAQSNDLEIDLSDVRFIDVAGLGVFYRAAVRLAERGGSVTLVQPPAPVPRMLELLGWHEFEALRVRTHAA